MTRSKAYFWFRLIAGDLPMLVVLITYTKIKHALTQPKGSAMRHLMKTSISQTTVILNPSVAASPNFRRTFHPSNRAQVTSDLTCRG